MERNNSESFIVLVNKPVGISSNAAVQVVKKAAGAKKCGHLGTLDLEGEGLLPVTVNGATKLFDYFLNKDKTYETIFVFGLLTDTLDTSGKVLKEENCDIKKEDVEREIVKMIGAQEQMPPQFSAKKVGGVSAYKSARQGKQVLLSPKKIEILDFKLLEQVSRNKFRFSISCSSGTYIRSIARDLGQRLGTCGVMQCILRTRCGGFFLKDAFSLDEIKSGNFKTISCDNVFNFPKIVVEKHDCERLLNGVKIKTNVADGKYLLYDRDFFLGVGSVSCSELKLELRLF